MAGDRPAHRTLECSSRPLRRGARAVALIDGRREIVAVAAAILIGIVVALTWYPGAAVVVGGILGPLVGLALPGSRSAVETPEPLAVDPATTGRSAETA